MAAAQARPRPSRGNPAPTEEAWGGWGPFPLDYWDLAPRKLGLGLLREVVGQTIARTCWDPKIVKNRTNEYAVPVHARIAELCNTTAAAVEKAYEKAVELGILEVSTGPHTGSRGRPPKAYRANLQRLRELPDRPNTRSGNPNPKGSKEVEELLQLDDELAVGSRRRPKAKNQKCPDGIKCRVKDFVLLENGSVKFGEVTPPEKTVPSKPPGSAEGDPTYPISSSDNSPRLEAATERNNPIRSSGIQPVTSIAATKGRNVWEEVKNALFERLDPVGYQNWIARTEFRAIEDGVVHVAVPNKPTATWLEDEYTSQITAALRPFGFSKVKYRVVSPAHQAEPEPEAEPGEPETIEAMTEMLEALVPLRQVGEPLSPEIARKVWKTKRGTPLSILQQCTQAKVHKFTTWAFAINVAEAAAKVWEKEKRRRRAAGA